jgi:hypothetical protein
MAFRELAHELRCGTRESALRHAGPGVGDSEHTGGKFRAHGKRDARCGVDIQSGALPLTEVRCM